MKRVRSSLWLSLVVLALVLSPWGTLAARSQDEPGEVLWLVADGPLTPSMHEYLKRGIRTGEEQQAAALVFQINTPGGSTDLMNRMIRDIRASQVPIVVYVAPRGGMAASAGTLITLAGHAAAMAPETTIGAASPVGGQGEDLGETMAAKIKNDLKATARTLGARRGEPAIEFVESAIDEAEAATEAEALELGLIDAVAVDRSDLLRQLDGLQVEINGEQRTLEFAFAQVADLEMTFIEQVLATLTNPNIIFILLIIGVQAILIELSSPGGWVAGFLGIVCLALASYGLGVLPVNWFGIVFLITAFVLFILELKTPTHGGLTAAGVGSLIVGALVLFNSPGAPQFQQVSIPLVLGSSLFTGLLFSLILFFALRARHEPVRTGRESLAGRTGFVQSDVNPSGIVQVAGEQWTAELADGEQSLVRGTPVQVVEVRGLRLIVRRLNTEDE